MNAKFFHYFVLFVLILNAIPVPVASKAKPDSRIIGGLPASELSIPYIVSLVTYATHTCGGAIIDERTILTAAHCLMYALPRRFGAHAGTTSLSMSEGVVIGAEAFIKHEEFNPETLDYDIALVRLEKPLKFSAKIQPIRLPEPTDILKGGDYVTISGWGLTKSRGRRSQDLRYARVPIINQTHCNVLLKNRVTDRMLCAGLETGGVDACQLDSGGPMVKENKIYGIVSWGIGCALPNKPGVYTRVQALLPWLNKTLESFNEQSKVEQK